MKSFKQYVNDEAKGSLFIWDIDETLFHTFARIKVLHNGKEVHSLDNQQFNTYELKDGESFDFGEFRSAKLFKETSKPIERMFAKVKAVMANTQNNPNTKIIIITARGDFDDKEVFLQTFRDHGIDIDKIYVERAANWGTGPSAPLKAKIIRKYIDTYNFKKVRLFDDAMSNLKAMLSLKTEYPDVEFLAYLADHSGSIKSIKESVIASWEPTI